MKELMMTPCIRIIEPTNFSEREIRENDINLSFYQYDKGMRNITYGGYRSRTKDAIQGYY